MAFKNAHPALEPEQVNGVSPQAADLGGECQLRRSLFPVLTHLKMVSVKPHSATTVWHLAREQHLQPPNKQHMV
jgi:hypothetical protein